MADHLRTAVLLALCAALAACQASAPRRAGTPDPTPPVTVAGNTDTATTPTRRAPRPKPAQPAPAVADANDASADDEAAIEQVDLWQRLRDSFALPGCDYTPGVRHWVGRYAASPPRFAGQLAHMAPAIDFAFEQLNDADIPGEFALLPIVESHYRPFPGSHSQPAGIWQMIAPTARSGGLRVDAWFDGRLNLAASTAAAVRILDRYAEHFDEDWRLVAFAYNAGEYRVHRALQRHTPGESAASLTGLGMPRTTLEYLDKLLALSCLVREPERFGLELPELDPALRLAPLEFNDTVGVSLARALSGMPRDEFDRVNAGLLKGRSPPGDAHTLLVRAPRLDTAELALAALPAARRLEWRQQALPAPDALPAIAAEHGLAPDVVLAVNDLDDTSSLSADTLLWLPGVGRDGDAVPANAHGSDVHVVRSGDSLWAIARRHGLTVSELLRYNRLNNSNLKPGQRLRLTAP